jgi:hypothetical protein
MSWPRIRSRKGWWVTNSSSSPTTSAWRPASKLGLDVVLGGLHELLQPGDRRLGERLVGEFGQGRPPPQPQGLPEQGRRLPEVPFGQGPPSLGGQGLEPGRAIERGSTSRT